MAAYLAEVIATGLLLFQTLIAHNESAIYLRTICLTAAAAILATKYIILEHKLSLSNRNLFCLCSLCIIVFQGILAYHDGSTHAYSALAAACLIVMVSAIIMTESLAPQFKADVSEPLSVDKAISQCSNLQVIAFLNEFRSVAWYEEYMRRRLGNLLTTYECSIQVVEPKQLL